MANATVRTDFDKSLDVQSGFPTKITFDLTPEGIRDFFRTMEYYTWDVPTPRKHLHPGFAIEEEGSVQESMLQAILAAKRIETLAYGYRWFDIKRYGIEIYRRHVSSNSQLDHISDTMTPGDLRRAFQVPQKARDAGFEATRREQADNN